jgi:hypothetical protein
MKKKKNDSTYDIDVTNLLPVSAELCIIVDATTSPVDSSFDLLSS